MKFSREHDAANSSPKRNASEIVAQQFNKKNKVEQQTFRLHSILGCHDNELHKFEEYLNLQQQVDDKFNQMLKDKSQKDEWTEAKKNMEYIFHTNEIIKGDFDIKKMNNPGINKNKIFIAKKIYELRLGSLNKKDRQEIISKIQSKFAEEKAREEKELDKLYPKPSIDTTTEIKDGRRRLDELSVPTEDDLDQTRIEQADPLKKTNNQKNWGEPFNLLDGEHPSEPIDINSLADINNGDFLTVEELRTFKSDDPEGFDKYVTTSGDPDIIDKQDELKEELQQYAHKVLKFIQNKNNKNRFKEYRKYFRKEQAYLKDKKMLKERLANNQHKNQPRERVNAEAFQEELTRMEYSLEKLKNRLHLDQLPFAKSLLKKIVNMSVEKLAEFDNNLFNKTNNQRNNAPANPRNVSKVA